MKLPEISYGGVPSVNAPGPQRAVTEYAQKQNILGKAQKAATDISNAARDFNVKKADAAYEQEMSDFMVSASERDVLSPGEVNAMDLDVDTEGREYLTKAEWYPQLLAKRQDEYRGKHAATIRSPVDRKKWEEATQKVDNNILEQEVERSAQISRDFAIVEREILADQALKAGNYDLADSYYTGPEWRSSPQRKAKAAAARSEIFIARKTDEVSLAMLKADTVEGYDAVLTMTTDPKWNEGLAPGSVLKFSNSVVAQRNAAIRTADDAESDAQDAVAIDTLIGLTDGTLTVQDVNDRAYSMGVTNHSRLISAARVQASGGIISSPGTIKNITQGIVDLRAGLYEGNFKDRVRELHQSVSSALFGIDPISGQPVEEISAEDASKLSKELLSVEDFPYKTNEYSALLTELNDRILGTDEGGLGFMASDESRQIRANAVNSLRQFVEDNGGKGADLSVWRAKYMPEFLGTASQADFLGLPKEAKDVVVYSSGGGGFSVDNSATLAAFKVKIADAKDRISRNESSGQKRLDDANMALNKYLEWYDRSGTAHNGN